MRETFLLLPLSSEAQSYIIVVSSAPVAAFLIPVFPLKQLSSQLTAAAPYYYLYKAAHIVKVEESKERKREGKKTALISAFASYFLLLLFSLLLLLLSLSAHFHRRRRRRRLNEVWCLSTAACHDRLAKLKAHTRTAFRSQLIANENGPPRLERTSVDERLLLLLLLLIRFLAAFQNDNQQPPTAFVLRGNLTHSPSRPPSSAYL